MVISVVAVIPARYDASRFPGKLLADRTGKTLLQHVYECVTQARRIDEILIAVDDDRLAEACDAFGAQWQMTRRDHPSGTDRIAEVAADLEADIIVNIQGDEPEMDPANIDRLVECLSEDAQADLSTLASRFGPGEDLNNPDIVKVVLDVQGRALYFSRWPIPYHRQDAATSAPPPHLKHLGAYAYRKAALLALSGMKPTLLERSERLEQLRALENGMVITVAKVDHFAVGIDTPQQYEDFVGRYQKATVQ